MSFTDDATCFSFTFLLAAKTDGFPADQQPGAWAATQNHCTAILRFFVLIVEGNTWLMPSISTSRPQAPCANSPSSTAPRFRRCEPCSTPRFFPRACGGLEALRHSTWLQTRYIYAGSWLKNTFFFGIPLDLSGLEQFGETAWVAVHDRTLQIGPARATGPLDRIRCWVSRPPHVLAGEQVSQRRAQRLEWRERGNCMYLPPRPCVA